MRSPALCASPYGPSGYGSGLILERGRQIGAGSAQRRREAEHHGREGARTQAESKTRRLGGVMKLSGGSICGMMSARRRMAQGAIASPSAPPASERRALSIRSCRMIRPRPAPRASRIATSFCRAVERAIIRLATFAHAISRTSPTIPITAHSRRRKVSLRYVLACAAWHHFQGHSQELLPVIRRGVCEFLLLHFPRQDAVEDGLKRGARLSMLTPGFMRAKT